MKRFFFFKNKRTNLPYCARKKTAKFKFSNLARSPRLPRKEERSGSLPASSTSAHKRRAQSTRACSWTGEKQTGLLCQPASFLTETAFIAWADYKKKNQVQKSLTGHKSLFLNACETSRCRCTCTHVWSEDLDPARFLLSPGVFEAEGHALLVCVPALHLPPLESYHLVLSHARKKKAVKSTAELRESRIWLTILYKAMKHKKRIRMAADESVSWKIKIKLLRLLRNIIKSAVICMYMCVCLCWILVDGHLQRSVLRARVQLEVMDADGRDDVAFPPGVTGAVRERHLVVALARPQQTQVLTEGWGGKQGYGNRAARRDIMMNISVHEELPLLKGSRVYGASGIILQFKSKIMNPMFCRVRLWTKFIWVQVSAFSGNEH